MEQRSRKNGLLIKVSKRISSIYFNIPALTKRVLPVVIFEQLVAAFCLNISAYFTKVDNMHFGKIGEYISFFYWGCLIGALLGAFLTLRIRSTKISGVCLVALGISLYFLCFSTDTFKICLAMLFMGAAGTTAATSNSSSLIRSVGDASHTKLKIISVELISFNLCFSFMSYILMYLTPIEIVLFSKFLSYGLIVIGGYSLLYLQNNVFHSIYEKKSLKMKLVLPDEKWNFSVLMIMVVLFGLIFSMVKVIYTPTLINRFGNSLISVAVASINPWLVFIVQPLIIDKIRKDSSSWCLGAGGLIAGISYFIFGFASSFWLTAISLVFLTFGEMLFAPLSKHYCVQSFKKGEEGLALGVWRFFFLGSGTIGPEISGLIADNYGSSFVWGLCGVFGLGCLLFSTSLKEMKNKAKCVMIN